MLWWYFGIFSIDISLNAFQNSSEKLKMQRICKASEKYVSVGRSCNIFVGVPKCYTLCATQFEKNLYHQHCLSAMCVFFDLCPVLGKVGHLWKCSRQNETFYGVSCSIFLCFMGVLFPSVSLLSGAISMGVCFLYLIFFSMFISDQVP